MRNILLAGLLGMAFFIPQAEASLFNFSYTNSNNTTISGVLNGALQSDSNVVLVVSVLDFVNINNIVGPALPVVDSFTNYFLGVGSVPPTVSLDGSLMDFIVTTATGNEALSFDSFGYLSSGTPQYMSTSAFDDIPSETYNAANWRMNLIPEPSTFLLIGICSLFLLTWRMKVPKLLS